MSDISNNMDLIFGRWKSQVLYTGVKLGILDYLNKEPKDLDKIGEDLQLDKSMLYRILRSLGSLNIVKEDISHRFSITPQGELFKIDHPNSLRGIVLLEEGPEHYQIWKHLPQLIKDGSQNAFFREFETGIFEYCSNNSTYREIFNEAMSSYSRLHTNLVLEALNKYDFSEFTNLCDIGGGQGHLLSHLLQKHSHLRGIILELQSVVQNQESFWPNKLGISDRLKYEAGNMFVKVPSADVYLMKMILHDWNDEECIKILSNIASNSSNSAKILIIEHIVPGPSTSHFSKLFDIHMMCATTGKERTIEEYEYLLSSSDWKINNVFYPESMTIGIIEAKKT